MRVFDEHLLNHVSTFCKHKSIPGLMTLAFLSEHVTIFPGSGLLFLAESKKYYELFGELYVEYLFEKKIHSKTILVSLDKKWLCRLGQYKPIIGSTRYANGDMKILYEYYLYHSNKYGHNFTRIDLEEFKNSPKYLVKISREIIRAKLPNNLLDSVLKSPKWTAIYMSKRGTFPGSMELLLTNPKRIMTLLEYQGDIDNEYERQVLELLIKHPDYLFQYVEYGTILPEFVNKVEEIALQEPAWSLAYSRHVIRDPWPKGEPIIIKDARCAYKYIVDILHKKWPEAIPIIIEDPVISAKYASIYGRWPLDVREYAEKIIFSCTKAAVTYIDCIQEFPHDLEHYALKNLDILWEFIATFETGIWPEAEPVLLTNHAAALFYATKVKKGRWPELEKLIINKPKYAFSYAKDIMKCRWPEAEKYFFMSAKYAFHYAASIIAGRWHIKKIEDMILQDSKYSLLYSEKLFELGIA